LVGITKSTNKFVVLIPRMSASTSHTTSDASRVTDFGSKLSPLCEPLCRSS